MDIKNIVKGTGVALEREAFSKFGAAVEQRIGNIFSG